MIMDKAKDFILQATYYNYNYGSVLQCYATQQYFKKHGIDCYLVKEKHTKINRVVNTMKRRIVYRLDILKYPEIKEANLTQINSTNMSVSSITDMSKEKIDLFFEKNIYSVNVTWGELKSLANSDKCNFCVAGSDQIWNANRVFIDPIYFLNFAVPNKRVALAPSFGAIELPQYNFSKYRKRISLFEKLSVREESGQNIIQELTGKKVPILMDPVFFLNQEEWRMASDIEERLNGKFVFAFFLDEPNKNAVERLKYYSNNGFDIYSVGYYRKALEEINAVVFDGGPEEFLTLIRRASVVVTDSFHATAFSTIFLKNFYVYKRNYYGPDQASRLIDYLKRLYLEYRYETTERELCDLSREEIDRIRGMIQSNYMKVESFLF